jgi:putative peptide zinc metalloprotease protein
MNGVKTFHDLYMEHVDAIGLVSPNLPAALYEKLEAMDMLAHTGDKAGKARWKELLQRVINPSFSIPKADEVVTAVHRRTKFLFTPLGAVFFVLLGLSGLIPLWNTHPLLMEKVAGLEQVLFDSPHILILLYGLTLVHVCLHELGHGTTCKHFGGKVPRLGIMFYLASFIFFCDTTAAYTFPEKRRRLLVSLAGPIVSFAVFGLGLWGAGYFAGGNSLWEYVFIAFSLFNFFGLVMNFNPFIKMDAYYMLMDLTEIPNLREKSFRFLNRKLWGRLGFGAEEDVKVTLREGRIFWWYGLLGSGMTFLFVAAPLLHLGHLLQTRSLHGGRSLLLVAGCTLFLVRMGTVALNKMRGMFYREYKLK